MGCGHSSSLVFPSHEGWALRRVNANKDALRPGSLKTKEESQVLANLEEEGRLGSFWIHVDTQLKSLSRIAEEKQYARVVKSDDAAVPEHLWEDHLLEGIQDDT